MHRTCTTASLPQSRTVLLWRLFLVSCCDHEQNQARCLTLCIVHSVMFSHAYPWSRSWMVASAGSLRPVGRCFPEGFLDLCYPKQHPHGLSGGIRSQEKFLCWIGIPEKLASQRCEKFGKQVYFQGFQRAGLQKQGKYYLST